VHGPLEPWTEVRLEDDELAVLQRKRCEKNGDAV